MTFSSTAISRAVPQVQIAVAAAAVTDSYTQIGAFPMAVETMNIVSTLNQPVTVSFDGVNDWQTVPAGSTLPVCLPYNFKTNNMVLNNAVFWVIAVAATPPNAGNLYISSFSSTIP